MILDKPTLLYVEDDNEIVQNIVFLLQDYFSEIFIAIDGEQAIDSYSQNKPDIVLLDINLPKINGIEVAKIIRKDDQEIPILFLTAYSDKDKLMSAINISASAYIVKPFKIDELKTAINKIMSKRNLLNVISLSGGFIWDRGINLLKYNSIEMKLTKKEIQLMNLLNKNRQGFFSACEISEELFPQNIKDNACNNSVQLLSRFKKKTLQTFAVKEFFIQNIYGIGYKLI